jgi:hypothetical protein
MPSCGIVLFRVKDSDLTARINAKRSNPRLLEGKQREDAIATIREFHYTQSVSAGKTHYFRFEDAIVAFSIPANKNLGKFLLGRTCKVWELSRMWAPDGHDRNLLTRAISASVKSLRDVEPDAEVLVSYADPNVGHHGGVYKAASWVATGQSEESRYYIGPDNEIAARRRFHSGRKILKKAEIEALGWKEAKLPGKIRFARGITRSARRELRVRFIEATA